MTQGNRTLGTLSLREVKWSTVDVSATTEATLVSVPSNQRAIILYLEYSFGGDADSVVYIQPDDSSVKYFQWHGAKEGGGGMRNLTQCGFGVSGWGEDIVYKQSAAKQLYITCGYVLVDQSRKELT